MSSAYIGPERRRFERIAASVDITCGVDNSLTVNMLVEERRIDAQILDLSQAGMAVETGFKLPLSTVLLMNIVLHTQDAYGKQSEKPMRITGEVRYCILSTGSKMRIGISFTDINKEDRDLIDAFVKQVKKNQPD